MSFPAIPSFLRTLRDIHPPSYDGIPLKINTTTTSGGRKVAIKQIANSDLQIVEDLGRKTRSFTLTGTVAATTDSTNNELITYHNYRDALQATLERGGGKDLVHPWYGKIPNVHCTDWSITESPTSVGDSPITLTMEVGSSDGLPLQGESVLASIEVGLDTIVAQVKADVEAGLDLEGSGNHATFLDKLGEVGDSIEDAASLVAAEADKISPFTKELSDFQGNLTVLAQAPGQMIDSVNNLFATMNGLYATAEATLQVYKDLFIFGDDNPLIRPFTTALRTRKRNDDLMNTAMRAQALAYSYLNAAQVEFGSVDEIEAESAVLEAQYQKMIADDFLGEEVQDQITDLRRITQQFFDDQKLTARRVITVSTHPIPARVLAYQYYGNSDLGFELMTLNGLQDPYLLEGNVQVFTE